MKPKHGLMLIAGLVAALLLGYSVRPDNLRPGVKYEVALRHLDSGNVDRAIAILDEVLADIPFHVPALHRRAVAYGRVGQVEAALGDFELAIELDPEYADVVNDRGILLARLGRDSEALRDFRRAIALAPGYEAARVNYAATLTRLERLDEALAALDLLGNEQDVDIRYLRASILLARGDHEQALEEFDELLALAPTNAKALLNRAVCLLRLGREDEAVQSFDEAVVHDDELMLLPLVSEFKSRLVQPDVTP